MKLGTSSPDFAPNGDASTRLDTQNPVELTFLAKDASDSLGSGGGQAVTLEQVINTFNSLIANTNIYELLDVSDASDSGAIAGDVLGWDGSEWTHTTLSGYTLPIATALVLGGVKIGTNVDVDINGVISVTFPPAYSLPIASGSVLGGIKVGTGLSIDGGGILSASASVPLDDLLDWDGTKYSPYATKKGSDPGYPYFYAGYAIPTAYNFLLLDGRFVATVLYSIQQISTITYTSSMDGSHSTWNYENSSNSHNTSGAAFIRDDGFMFSCSTTQFGPQRQKPIYIGKGPLSPPVTIDEHGEYLKMDDYNRLFEINTTNIKLTKGTPSKWLALDSSGFITYQDAPAAAYVHPSYPVLSPTLTGASVLAALSVDATGHVIAATARTLTLSDLGLDDSNLVHLSGTEIITGDKTFSGTTTTSFIVASTGSAGVTINATSDYVGILGQGTSVTDGYGVVGFSPNIPIQAANLNTVSSGLRTVLSLRGDSANTVGANEYGLTIDFLLPVLGWVNPFLSETISAQINAVWTDITQDAEYARMDWWLMQNGTLTKVMALEGAGDLTIYGDIIANNFRQTIYTITLPNAGSVAARCAAAVSGVDYPSGWTIAAYGLNPNDIEITHTLSRRITSVTIFEVNGATEERQLFANAAYSGVVAPTQDQLRVEALATVAKPIVIHLLFD